MRGEAIKKFKEILKKNYNLDLKVCSCIELFARDGSWQTQYILNDAKFSEAWEIDTSYANLLRQNLPNTDLIFCDSIQRLKKVKGNFNVIIADNPQGVFGSCGQYCEHFDIIENVHNLINKSAWLIFNINRKPFNYIEGSAWMKRRKLFYKTDDTGNLTRDFFLNFYTNFFIQMNCKVKNSFVLDRNNQYLSYLCIQIEVK